MSERSDFDWGGSVATAAGAWLVLLVGFIGLRFLMEERPQFVGQPGHVSSAELVQRAPRLVVRRAADDVAMVNRAQPVQTEILFDLTGRRDYRGLRTVVDMAGEFTGTYVITNQYDEPLFALFQCPHPRVKGRSGGMDVRDLRLETAAAGQTEDLSDAWLWTGTLDPHGSVKLTLSYRAAALVAVRYEIGEEVERPIAAHRVEMRHRDLESIWLESSDGRGIPSGESMLWVRENFLPPDYFTGRILETRSLLTSLMQLVEVGPLVSALFLLTALAGTGPIRKLTGSQVLMISAGFGLYFPLVVYLSSQLSFGVALAVAAAVPGALLLNFGRWLFGAKVGVIGGGLALVLFQIFPTYAAFSGWNRGMLLLCLGVVTLSVLIQRQNRLLRQQYVGGLGLLMLSCLPGRAQEAQVFFPAQLLPAPWMEKVEPRDSSVSMSLAAYDVQRFDRYLGVKVSFRVGANAVDGMEPTLVPLFDRPVYLLNSAIRGEGRLGFATNGLHWVAVGAEPSEVTLEYRVPVAGQQGWFEARVPLVRLGSGRVTVDLPYENLEVEGGAIWSRAPTNGLHRYEIGVAMEKELRIRWGGDQVVEDMARSRLGANALYGIGITDGRHLTVLDSTGGCTHFAEYALPQFHDREFALGLPPDVSVLSVAVDGVELKEPRVEDGRCRLELGMESGERRVSFKLAYPPVRLGFAGTVDLSLPRHESSVGRLSWAIVLPMGFEVWVVSSGLERLETAADLLEFGDYGRVLGANPRVNLGRSLVSPGAVPLGIGYRQTVEGFWSPRAGD